MPSVYAAIAPSKSPLSRSKLRCFVVSSSGPRVTNSPSQDRSSRLSPFQFKSRRFRGGNGERVRVVCTGKVSSILLYTILQCHSVLLPAAIFNWRKASPSPPATRSSLEAPDNLGVFVAPNTLFVWVTCFGHAELCNLNWEEIGKRIARVNTLSIQCKCNAVFVQFVH
jgi:hypothetical protein